MIIRTLSSHNVVDGWQLVSLLPDIEVSDLEKQMNNKLSGDDLSLCRLKLYHFEWIT